MSDTLTLCLLAVVVVTMVSTNVSVAAAARQPVYKPETANVEKLRAEIAPLLAMDEGSMADLVPPQAGFTHVACPNCQAGCEDNQLVWNLSLGRQVQCRYCKQLFPNEQYPDNERLELRGPTGKTQVFTYFLGKDGNQHWFEGRRWHEQLLLMEKSAYQMAELYSLTGDRTAGRRAAIILKRFAGVYPDYIVRADNIWSYTKELKKFFPEGYPSKQEIGSWLSPEPFCAAKWNYWAYEDVSEQLLKAYDLIAGTDLLTAEERAHVENDLFRGMLAYVNHIQTEYPALGNAHPLLWRRLMVASRVLGDASIAKGALREMRRMLTGNFFYDGFWYEPSLSYGTWVANQLREVLQMLKPELSGEGLDAWIASEHPDLANALQAYKPLRLPDGSYVPMGDTAWHKAAKEGPLQSSNPVLMPGLGYAILGVGSGSNQFQTHLSFTNKNPGHFHYDRLNLTMYAFEKELISDIGYDQTRYRMWASTTASHNTVVVDQKCQPYILPPNFVVEDEFKPRPKDYSGAGRLLLFDASDPKFQVVESDVPGIYPGITTTYRRLLAAIESENGDRYVVDVFDVAGGKRHDWMLHGSADENQSLEIATGDGLPLPSTALDSLLPEGMTFVEPTHELDFSLIYNGLMAYGMFRNARESHTDGDFTATFSGLESPKVGVRSCIVGSPGTRVFAAKSPAVRTAENDNTRVADYWRQSLVVRRDEERSRFVAVHCPFNGDPVVSRVARLRSDPGSLALRIERSGVVDYFVLNSDEKPHKFVDGDVEFELAGRVALATQDKNRYALKMIDGTNFTFDGKSVSSEPPASAKLSLIEGSQYEVDGEFPVKTGDIVIIRHGDNSTTAFHVYDAKSVDRKTRITTVEPAAFTGSADGALDLKYYPHLALPAPHIVTVSTETTAQLEKWRSE